MTKMAKDILDKKVFAIGISVTSISTISIFVASIFINNYYSYIIIFIAKTIFIKKKAKIDISTTFYNIIISKLTTIFIF